jgi:hypothetical protein
VRCICLIGPKRDEITRESRKLHNGELHNLCWSPNIIRQIKSRWAWHVACMREGREVYRVLVGRRERKRPLGRPRRSGRMGLWTLRRWSAGCGVDSPSSGWGLLAGCCECGDEPSVSGTTELVSYLVIFVLYIFIYVWSYSGWLSFLEVGIRLQEM